MLEYIKEYLEKANNKCNEIQNGCKYCYDCNYSESLCDITDKYPYEILNEIEELENIKKIIPRKLVVPGIYRHFKHTEDGIPNNYMYAVRGIAEAIEFTSNFYKTSKPVTICTETETNEIVHISLKDGKYYVDSRNGKLKGKYVVYDSMYNGSVWCRHYDMFMSEVDHEKYPDIKQKYRFELVR